MGGKHAKVAHLLGVGLNKPDMAGQSIYFTSGVHRTIRVVIV